MSEPLEELDALYSREPAMKTIGSVAIDQSQLKTIAQRLREKYGAQRIILFGSAARGEATEHSDIDLLVIAKTTERFYERMASVLGIVRDVSIGIPLAPIVLTPEELQSRLERDDQFVQDIVNTGVDL